MEKPKPPTREQLHLEEVRESVTLPDRKKMSDQLSGIRFSSDERERFVPKLLKYAGETMPIERVPRIVVDAIREYHDGKDQKNARYFMDKHAPLIVDAMVTGLDEQIKARDFLADALNG